MSAPSIDCAKDESSKHTGMIIDAAFEAGFKDCRERVEGILAEAMNWPIPQKLTSQQRRRYIVMEIMKRVEKIKP